MTKAADTSLRQNRIPIMMSDGEIKAVDDWMFSHRFRSRSEAIRQLVAIGLQDLHDDKLFIYLYLKGQRQA